MRSGCWDWGRGVGAGGGRAEALRYGLRDGVRYSTFMTKMP